MVNLNKTSLAETIDELNEAFFFGKKINSEDSKNIAVWIAGRAGMERGSYANMPAPTELDLKNGIKLFTGEKITTGAGTMHILGEEACRALYKLGIKSPEVKRALKIGTDEMYVRIASDDRDKDGKRGDFCCGTCSVAFWRHLVAGGFNNQEDRLMTGMKLLKKYRQADGKWRRFPFYYTLLALDEIDLPLAKNEMKYAAPVLERVIKRKGNGEKYDTRRRALVERILSKV